MGMNSLTAVELKRLLEAGVGQRLPDPLTFNYPTIEKLSSRLEIICFGEDSEAKPPADEMDDYSEEELIAILAKKVGR